MPFLKKIGLLFKVKKPLGDLVDAVAQAKKTKKWASFGLTVLSIVGSCGAAFAGILPPAYAIGIPAVANSIYNIFRGADKADNMDVKGLFTTSELYVTAGQEAQKLLQLVPTLQAQGADIPLVVLGIVTSIASWGTLAAGQNLAARVPDQSGELKAELIQK